MSKQAKKARFAHKMREQREFKATRKWVDQRRQKHGLPAADWK
jgi:hypothetical protein